MTKRTARNCAACGKDLYRKKVWEKHGKKVIGYCCAVTYTFRLDGSIRRRDDPNVLRAPVVEQSNNACSGLCPRCRGLGHNPCGILVLCPDCGGSGKAANACR